MDFDVFLFSLKRLICAQPLACELKLLNRPSMVTVKQEKSLEKSLELS